MLSPTAGSGDCQILAGPQRSLCKLIVRNSGGRAVCQQFARTVPTGHRRRYQTKCFTGLITLAVPILVNQRPVARLMCGQVFCKPPTDKDFDRIWNHLSRLGLPLKRQQVARAFFQTRVASADQVAASVELLEQMVQRLTARLQQWMMRAHTTEPPCVQAAKKLVEVQLVDGFTTRQAARATHVSSQYFCRAFKIATGMTFTAYVSGRRIDRAKELLALPNARILEVSSAVGFNSSSRFAQVFKRSTGVTAMAFRQAVALGENR